jgi:hypothetical protein
MQLSSKTLLALLPYFLQANAGASGTGTTTRYWDCCKPSCAWPGKVNLAAGATPVKTCDIKDKPLTDPNASSGCSGGTAYQCSNESPWAINDDLAYGYAAVNIAGGTEASWCCACYELTFTSGPVAGKKMIVQATNTGGDLAGNQFDLSIPGGGVGIFNGCTDEWGAPSAGWGAQYGGISSRSSCDSFPEALKAGCYWRYDWFMGADNPGVTFTQVACPAALTANTGCARADDSSAPAAVAPAASGAAPASPSASPVASSSSSPAAQAPAASTPDAQPEPAATTSAAQQEPPSSSTPAAVTSTPAVSPGIFAQPPSSSDITTPSPSTTTSAYLEVVTVTIDACEAQYPLGA